MTSPSAGWYPDPSGQPSLRFWDGLQWTLQTKADVAPGTPTSGATSADDSKVSIFGAKAKLKELQGELDAARHEGIRFATALAAETVRASAAEATLAELGGLEVAEIQRRIVLAREEHATAIAQFATQTDALRAQLHSTERELQVARSRIVATEETEVLQEVGVYEYRHPVQDAVAFQSQLKTLQGRIKEMAKAAGGAVSGATDWTVNGSVTEGRRMVRENSKLMLRAYNAEADNLVRSMKPYKLDAAVNRLTKTGEVIQKLGRTMQISISPLYHQLRVQELELTADFLARKAEEKEREKADRERLREEAKVQAEIKRERERLEHEQTHYRNALARLEESGDDSEAIARLRAQLDEIDGEIESVDFRAANIRAGYVYVISNIGSFGGEVVKIGLTRRLEPLDRVRELGDASVPFRYDVHALYFSADALTLENSLHRHFADRRINRVNERREFFRVTPQEVKDVMADLAGDLLEFNETAEALEFRQSTHLTNEADLASAS